MDKPMNKIILAQTDTTVGFLSRDADALARVKGRPPHKQFLKVYAGLESFKANGGRVPNTRKARLRCSKKTTYIVKGSAFRIISEPRHYALVKPYGWLYSTSANQSGHGFERSFCEANADIIVEDVRGFRENPPSSIIRLGKTKMRRLR